MRAVIARLLVLAFLLAAAHPAAASALSESTASVSNSTVFRMLLGTALNIRCQRYYRSYSLSAQLQECTEGIQSLIREMDMTRICENLPANGKQPAQKNCAVVTFKNDLLELLDEPRVYRFLENLNQTLQDISVLPNLSLNLWDATANFAKSDREALLWLSVLFQDTSKERAHLHWAKLTHLNDRQLTIWKTLYRTHDLIEQVYYRARNPRFQPLPFPMAPSFRSGPYHFYVIAELQTRLQEDNVEPRLTRLLPFLLNYIYEIKGLSNDQLRPAFEEPSTITDIGTAYDIYLGYRAVTWGLEGVSYEPVGFSRFSKALKKDPSQLLHFAVSY